MSVDAKRRAEQFGFSYAFGASPSGKKTYVSRPPLGKPATNAELNAAPPVIKRSAELRAANGTALPPDLDGQTNVSEGRNGQAAKTEQRPYTGKRAYGGRAAQPFGAKNPKTTVTPRSDAVDEENVQPVAKFSDYVVGSLSSLRHLLQSLAVDKRKERREITEDRRNLPE